MSVHHYSNPRKYAEFTDWPYGKYRTTCTFLIETVVARGERAIRTTINPKTGRLNAPKFTTYARSARIVDGDDGRTYILELVAGGSHLHVWQSDMQHDEEVIFPRDPRYAELLALATSVV